MLYKELIPLTPEALNQKLIEQEQTLSQLRFAHAISPLEKPLKIRATRQIIARIKTLQHARKHTP